MPAAIPETRKKILIVDDSNMVLLFEQMVLRPEGFTLCVARGGREGVEKALAERPDLILMDVQMPDMSGLDACVRLRQESATRATPIILVTTKGQQEDIEEGFR